MRSRFFPIPESLGPAFKSMLLVVACVLATASCAELKRAGKDIGHGTRDAAKAIGHGARDVAREVGKAVNKAVKDD